MQPWPSSLWLSRGLLQVFSPFVSCMAQLHAPVFPWLTAPAVHAHEPGSFISSQRVPLAGAVDGAMFKAQLTAQTQESWNSEY